MKLILASQSPRRKMLLEKLGLDFQVIVSEVEEDIPEENPVQLVEKLALKKARGVAQKATSGLVLGADTVVALEGTILGKPQSKEEAVKMLQLLNGKTHQVITGVALVEADGGKSLVDHEITRVTFRNLEPEEIQAYVHTGEPLDKAGGYGIQGLGGLLVEKIEGCYDNVVGLPLTKLYLMLKKFGIDIFKH